MIGNDGADGVRLVERGDADGDALGVFQRDQCAHIGELSVVKSLHQFSGFQFHPFVEIRE